MIFTLRFKTANSMNLRDGFIASLESRVLTLGNQHPGRQPVLAAQTLLRESGHQLTNQMGIWYFLIGMAILVGFVGLVLVFRQKSTKRTMIYWASSLLGVVLLFLGLTEWAYHLAFSEMALITNQTYHGETQPLQTYGLAKDAIPSPEPLVRGGGLVAPLFPGIPGNAPNNSSLPPIPKLPELNLSPPGFYRPAKPFTIKSIGILPDAPNLSYFGYEITVPPEQLISIGLFEESPEAKRVRLLDTKNYQIENQAYGLLYNPTKEPKRAIWAIGFEKQGNTQLDSFKWRLEWADQTDSKFLNWSDSGLIRDSFLRLGLQFIYVPTVVSSKDSTECRLEMQARDDWAEMLKALGGKATSYIQFRSLPMPEGGLKLNPSIGNDPKGFQGNSADSLKESLSKPITKPILGMKPKYWEWFSGFEAPKEDSWVQITVHSLENIKFLGFVCKQNQVKDFITDKGFLGGTKIKIQYDSVSMNPITIDKLANDLLTKGFHDVRMEQLPKSPDGTGEMWFYNHLQPKEALLKIVEPKIQEWNRQQREKSPNEPEATLTALGESHLLKAKGSYDFLKVVKPWIDKANEAAILPTVPGPSHMKPNLKEAPARDPSPKAPAPKDSPSNPPLKKDAPKGDSPKKDLPTKK